MLKKFFAVAMFTLALSVVLSGTAGAENTQPATPTDLTPVCPHEHTQTTIYFFDTRSKGSPATSRSSMSSTSLS